MEDEHKAYLRDSFVKQRVVYVNLLEDLGSTDVFLIDGDALLLDCLGNPSSNLRHGCQMLPLDYIVEDFLCSLTRCLNARFEFVWFQSHECIWQDPQQFHLLLARHVQQQHLAVTLQQTFHKFVSWQDSAWLDFLKQVCTLGCWLLFAVRFVDRSAFAAFE